MTRGGRRICRREPKGLGWSALVFCFFRTTYASIFCALSCDACSTRKLPMFLRNKRQGLTRIRAVFPFLLARSSQTRWRRPRPFGPASTKRDGVTLVRNLRIENVDTNAIVLSVLAGMSEAPLSDVTFDRVVVHVEPTRLTTRRIGTWRDIRYISVTEDASSSCASWLRCARRSSSPE